MDAKSLHLALSLLIAAGCSGAVSSDTCGQLSAKAKAEVESAAADAGTTCMVDADCTTVAPAACYASCEYPVSKAGAEKLKSAVQQVNDSTCAEYHSDGCPVVPICLGPARHVACVSGHCAVVDDVP